MNITQAFPWGLDDQWVWPPCRPSLFLCKSIDVVWSRNLNKFDIKLTSMFSKWFWSESGPWWRGSSRGPLWAVSNFSRHQKFKGNSCKDHHVNNCWDQVVVLRWWHWTVSLGSRTLGLEGCCENDTDVVCVTRMKMVDAWPWLAVGCFSVSARTLERRLIILYLQPQTRETTARAHPQHYPDFTFGIDWTLDAMVNLCKSSSYWNEERDWCVVVSSCGSPIPRWFGM